MAKKPLKKRAPFNPDALGLFCLAVGSLAFLALWSFSFLHPKDNWLGYLGYFVALGAQSLFGLGSYLIPCYLGWLGVRLLKGAKLVHVSYDHAYFLILLGSVCMLLTVFAESYPDKARVWDGRVVSETLAMHVPYPRTLVRFYLGGFPFYYLFSDFPGVNLQRTLSPVGTTLIFFSLGLVSFLLLTRVKVVSNARAFWLGMIGLANWVQKMLAKKPTTAPPATKAYTGLKINNLPPPEPKKKITEILKPEKKIKPVVVAEPAPVIKKEAPAPKKETIPVPTKSLMVRSDSSYKLPPPSLLMNPSQKVDQPTLKKDLMQQAAILEETLKSFGIEAKVGEINSGPTITSFEVHPSIGVKVQVELQVYFFL